ncbi:sugar isomerase domain-containing protein [Streptomyces sp. NPDC005303]|uniref:sugar isomerase domain-containing protein n=1 Tax=Streptomyces sp. NPDC005303 TaxID=3155713 RepID=UPI0033A9C6A1
MDWIQHARHLLDVIERTQQEVMEAAADIAADAIGGGGVVHMLGTGHSRIPVEEMFPRYGSYPGWHPIVELSMTFHTEVAGANGQRQAMFIERVPGLAEVVFSNFELRPTDAIMIFSAGGRNAFPVEAALLARKAGLKVVAVTSLAEARSVPATHSSGTVLADNADVVIDLCTPTGDAACVVEGWEQKVGPTSTIANVAIVNTVKVLTARRLAERGIELPVLTGAQIAGAERSAELFENAYLEHARRKAGVLKVSS